MKYSLDIKNILFKTGIISLCHRLSKGNNAAILRYHSIARPEDNYYSSYSIAINPDEFENQVRFFAENCNVISLDTAEECIREKKQFPDKAVVLTFDDGYKDNFSAYEIMKKYGIHGTFYISAGCIGREGEYFWLSELIYLVGKTKINSFKLQVKGKDLHFQLRHEHEKEQAIRKITEIIKSNNLKTREDIREQLNDKINDVSDICEKMSNVMLTWEQVKEMSDKGMTIGGHTMTHLNLPNADYEDAVHEIYECRRLIEEKTGRPALHFSYPNGGNYDYYNSSIMNIVKEAGYVTSTTSNNGWADLQSNPFELRRIRITPDLSEIMYQAACEPLINKVLRRN